MMSKFRDNPIDVFEANPAGVSDVPPTSEFLSNPIKVRETFGGQEIPVLSKDNLLRTQCDLNRFGLPLVSEFIVPVGPDLKYFDNKTVNAFARQLVRDLKTELRKTNADAYLNYAFAIERDGKQINLRFHYLGLAPEITPQDRRTQPKSANSETQVNIWSERRQDEELKTDSSKIRADSDDWMLSALVQNRPIPLVQRLIDEKAWLEQNSNDEDGLAQMDLAQRRALRLPDDATDEQVTEAWRFAIRDELLTELGLPASATQDEVEAEYARRMDQVASGDPHEHENLNTKAHASAHRHNTMLADLLQDRPSEYGQRLLEEQSQFEPSSPDEAEIHLNDLNLAQRRALRLPDDATDEQVDEAWYIEIRGELLRELGLPGSATDDEIEAEFARRMKQVGVHYLGTSGGSGGGGSGGKSREENRR